jgi:hypothetical protein
MEVREHGDDVVDRSSGGSVKGGGKERIRVGVASVFGGRRGPEEGDATETEQTEGHGRELTELYSAITCQLSMVNI